MSSATLRRSVLVLFALMVSIGMSGSVKAAATIVIQNNDAAGVGFNDATAAAPVGGNTGTTLGAQRLQAFQAAANTWGATLTSTVTITIRAQWTALACTTSSAVLGSAGAISLNRDFVGATFAGTWYSVALANKLNGSDTDPANPDINANFNVNLGNPGCLDGHPFYLGLDNLGGAVKVDLVTVLQHEFAHGLGFQTFTNSSTGAQFVSGTASPTIFDRFLVDATTGKSWVQMTDAERQASAINNLNLLWDGPRVTTDAATVLSAGKDATGKPLMYSPNPVQGGSSVSHWDTTAFQNQLMEPLINTDLTHSVTTPQDLTFSELSDVGWVASSLPSSISSSAGNPESTNVNTPFPIALQATITTAIPGLTVTFTAPAAGASGVFTNTGTRTTTAVTNALGVATASTFSANAQTGSYLVNAAVPGAGSTTFALTNTNLPVAGGACFTDTTQADFQAGATNNTDTTTSPGDVTLLNPVVIDQQNTAGTTTGTGFGTPNWTGQTFIPAVSGNLVKVDLPLFCSNGASPCTGPTGNLILSVRNTSAGLPTGADLATATIPGFTSNVGGTFTATFASPPALTSGTQYALILRPVSNPAAGSYAWIRSSPSTYANGQRVTSADSGGTWAGDVTRDFNFIAYMQTGNVPSGDFVSSLKDANPPFPNTFWSTMSWTATVPANTTLRFQVAASNNFAGPFNFIGPGGTAATFYTTSPASISQFNGNRYLKYKAFFATTNSAVTATLNDVTVCLNNPPTAAPATISGQITTANGSPLAGVTVSLSGATAATAITNSSGAYQFDNVATENFYTVTPALVNYRFTPASRSFSLLGNETDAAFTAVPDALPTTNAIDTDEFFVRQQYLDFLGREPDQGGLAFWSGKLNQCNGDAGCLSQQRVEVSAAFFQSAEFGDTGAYVYRLYQGALGRQLSYNEFATDRGQVVGGVNLDASKAAFATAFVNRAEFAQKYQANTTGESFVDALLQTLRDSAGVDLSGERGSLIDHYNAGGTMNEGRGLVVRDVAENASFASAVYNPSFVLMEYFGYLKRGAEPDGYAFWLNVLNTSDAGNYRGMVCSFLTSTEYQRRFGSVVTRTNAECGR